MSEPVFVGVFPLYSGVAPYATEDDCRVSLPFIKVMVNLFATLSKTAVYVAFSFTIAIASFKLDADGGDVLLTAADKSWSDRISYMPMNGDESVGRYPDGSSNVVTMNVPTIAKSNLAGSYSTVISQPEQTGIDDIHDITTGLSMRYVVGRLVVRSPFSNGSAKMDIYNVAGVSFGSRNVSLYGGYAELSLDELPSGYYIARLSDGNGHTTTCKFIKK